MFFKSTPLNKIGFYQFENLVNNRVPFLFLNFAQDISNWYTSIYKLHVETYQVLLEPQNLMKELEERKIPLDFAILLLCSDGKQSEKIAKDLGKKGYTNVYLIDGGYQQMVTDKG
ncbi:MAG: rhodanese-like domain-containing protein [Pseudobdellovibrio sp.]